MIIGILGEIKDNEYRVGVTPGGVEVITQAGHTALVQSGAGLGSGYSDQQYADHGAKVFATAEQVWGEAEMIVKVKEPLPTEWPMMRRGQGVFTYFHFAASKELTEGVAARGIVAIAYETITDPHGQLPLLTPMSEVAGRMAVQVGAHTLEKPSGGGGVLLGGVPGVMPARVVILGGGVVGSNAASMAAGMGADVLIFDIKLDRLRYLADVMPANVRTVKSEPASIRAAVATADLVIGAVLIPGGRTPILVQREDLKAMKQGAVIVDVGVDQGGCVETTRPTTHHDPTYVVDGVVHYCVANMPGAVPRTSTQALTNATLPYVLQLAESSWQEAAAADPHLAAGVNMVDGQVTCPGVAEAHAMELAPLKL